MKRIIPVVVIISLIASTYLNVFYANRISRKEADSLLKVQPVKIGPNQRVPGITVKPGFRR
ncbi:MAG TPA: hypothetical protein VIK74_01425 [Parasegetibacter sp.]